MRKVPFALALTLLASVALAQAPARPGAELRFATLGSSGGMQGTAFLPIPWSAVRAVPTSGRCTGRLEIKGRGLRGFVREVTFDVPAGLRVGDHTIGTACDQVAVKIKIEDGTEAAGTGTLHVTTASTTGPVRFEFDLEFQPIVRGSALPMTGHVIVPAAPAAP